MTDLLIHAPQGPETEIPVTSFPGVPGLFSKMIALSLIRPGHLEPGTVLSNPVFVYKNFKMDPAMVRQFKAVCGYGPDSPDSLVPAPCIQPLFIGVISRFISSSHFPINPMGLIQVGQSFSLKRPVAVDESLDLHCRLMDMTQSPKGIHTRFELSAWTGPELVWQGMATYFTRAKHPPEKEKTPHEQETPLTVRETITVPADIGRRYAAVSRDYNPHHLYPWTAKLIGFKRAIAHGIWSLARTCASLETAFGYPDTLEMEGALKLPIFLPGTITLGFEAQENHVRFELRDRDKGLPHLKGSFRF